MSNLRRSRRPTKVSLTGIDTIPSNKISLINRLSFWKSDRTEISKDSSCEGCCFGKDHVDGDLPNRSLAGKGLSDEIANPLTTKSKLGERAHHDKVEKTMVPSESSIPRSAPITFPSSIKHARSCGLKRGLQEDGNVGLVVEDADLLNVSQTSNESVVKVTIGSPAKQAGRFSAEGDSLPRNTHFPNAERGIFRIDEDVEEASDLELSTLPSNSTLPSTDHLKSPRDTSVFKSGRLPVMDLEAELKDAMNSSIPRQQLIPKSPSSISAVSSNKIEDEGINPAPSLTESFSRTKVSLSEAEDHSEPPGSLLVEKPFSYLGSNFVDVEEEYLIQHRASFPLPNKFPALDSSATTDDFGFRPTCAQMPGSWPGDDLPKLSEELDGSPNTWRDMFPIKNCQLSPSARFCDSFFRPKDEIRQLLKGMGRYTSPQLERYRSSDSPCYSESLPSPTFSPPPTSYEPQIRGGGEPVRFSLFRSVGQGKLVGNAERGKLLLDKQVSGFEMVGGWGKHGTWRELCEEMEKRRRKRKQIDAIEGEISKLQALKEKQEPGAFAELITNVKGWFVKSGNGDEDAAAAAV